MNNFTFNLSVARSFLYGFLVSYLMRNPFRNNASIEGPFFITFRFSVMTKNILLLMGILIMTKLVNLHPLNFSRSWFNNFF